MPAAVVKDGTVTPKFRQGKISPPFLTAKFSPRNSPLAKISPPLYSHGTSLALCALHVPHGRQVSAVLDPDARGVSGGPEGGGGDIRGPARGQPVALSCAHTGSST